MKQSYTIQEAAKVIGVGVTKTYQMINERKLSARKLGKRTIILRGDLEDFLSNLESYPSQKKEG